MLPSYSICVRQRALGCLCPFAVLFAGLFAGAALLPRRLFLLSTLITGAVLVVK